MNNPNIKIPLQKNPLFTDELLLLSNTSLGNTLKFTHPSSYENIKGLNFTSNSIIDLNKIVSSLHQALTFLKGIKNEKGLILFVGTRPDMRNIVEKLGTLSNMPYISHRWLKGLLTIAWCNGKYYSREKK